MCHFFVGPFIQAYLAFLKLIIIISILNFVKTQTQTFLRYLNTCFFPCSIGHPLQLNRTE